MKTLKTVKGRSGFSPKPIKPSMRHDNNENRGDTPVLKHPLPPNVFTRKKGGGHWISQPIFFFQLFPLFAYFYSSVYVRLGRGLRRGVGTNYPSYKGRHYISSYLHRFLTQWVPLPPSTVPFRYHRSLLSLMQY